MDINRLNKMKLQVPGKGRRVLWSGERRRLRLRQLALISATAPGLHYLNPSSYRGTRCFRVARLIFSTYEHKIYLPKYIHTYKHKRLPSSASNSLKKRPETNKCERNAESEITTSRYLKKLITATSSKKCEVT